MIIDTAKAYKMGQLVASSSASNRGEVGADFYSKLAAKLRKELFPEATDLIYNKFTKTSEILSKNRFSAAAKIRLKKVYGG